MYVSFIDPNVKVTLELISSDFVISQYLFHFDTKSFLCLKRLHIEDHPIFHEVCIQNETENNFLRVNHF